MARWFRRFIWLGLLGGAGAAAYTVWHRRQAERSDSSWLPADPAPLRLVGDEPVRAPTAAAPLTDEPSPTDAPLVDEQPDGTTPADVTWVPSVDGACPSGFPIKGNANSRIYHVPGGRFYDRTVPQRCYATPADAEADGYRAAKS
jgi:hypothetical protein